MSNSTHDKPIVLTSPTADYTDWLADLKGHIHTAQQHATLAVNRELVLFYWQIGHDILTLQAAQGWGAKVIARQVQDLYAAFAEVWPDTKFVQQAAAQLLQPIGLTGWEFCAGSTCTIVQKLIECKPK
jgi:hypothetical protein